MTHRHLTRESIVDAAAAVADRVGLSAVSMRNVAAEVGAQAMSLYHHVDNKDDLLFALAEWPYAHIPVPHQADPWRSGLHHRATTMLVLIKTRPWLCEVMGAPTPGPAQLAHYEAMLTYLVAQGFPPRLGSSTLYAVDSYVIGFASLTRSVPVPDAARTGLQSYLGRLGPTVADFPMVASAVTSSIEEPANSVLEQVDIGLDLLLDGLGRRLTEADDAA
ncbi:TetR/AcrR family transcriptional regulator [Microbacterium sp.]|uniref:TetR/AcrR family transcriptional regulator n=1 Tax=Microbacterium sp. TaxID=51671 RepID=UPI003A8AF113